MKDLSELDKGWEGRMELLNIRKLMLMGDVFEDWISFILGEGKVISVYTCLFLMNR